jgi:histidyl-tRNA synthetase
VRGLDYYTRTVFEVVSGISGRRTRSLGGGRYDDLVGELGGQPVPGIGFAIGEDRLLSVLPESFRTQVTAAPPLVVVALGAAAEEEALRLAEEVRTGGRECLLESGRGLKAALKRADRLGARRVLLLGDDELAGGEVTVKDLAAGTQRRVRRDALAAAWEDGDGES